MSTLRGQRLGTPSSFVGPRKIQCNQRRSSERSTGLTGWTGALSIRTTDAPSRAGGIICVTGSSGNPTGRLPRFSGVQRVAGFARRRWPCRTRSPPSPKKQGSQRRRQVRPSSTLFQEVEPLGPLGLPRRSRRASRTRRCCDPGHFIPKLPTGVLCRRPGARHGSRRGGQGQPAQSRRCERAPAHHEQGRGDERPSWRGQPPAELEARACVGRRGADHG